jgi:hypothetical protein
VETPGNERRVADEQSGERQAKMVEEVLSEKSSESSRGGGKTPPTEGESTESDFHSIGRIEQIFNLHRENFKEVIFSAFID